MMQAHISESLAGLGITKAQAQQGYANVAEILPRGSQLADIYGEQPYTQQTAEAEVFNTQGSAQAAARRRKLKSLEEASFSGSSGVGALGRDKAIYGGASGQAGLY
jgi:GTP cyclohydrolase III